MKTLPEPVHIAVIVEGHGECEAVPLLIRRIALSIDPGYVPHILTPIRIPASRLRNEGGVERAVILASRKLYGMGGIIVILDCDWDDCCPARDGPKLLARAEKVCGNLPISVILAKKEYESWFLAAAESLRGKGSLPPDLVAPDQPEEIRGAKEWLSKRMPRGICYTETADQARFTEFLDMDTACRADSFDKCRREIHGMLMKLRNSTS